MAPKLDYRPRHDERSRAYAIRPELPSQIRYTKREWRIGRVLDQGKEGACVPHAWLGEAMASPVRVDVGRLKLPAELSNDPQALAFQLYDICRRIDEFEGDDTDGTSVLAGAKVMQQLGLLHSYRWAFTTADVRDTILTKGPVVLGVRWMQGMYAAPGGELNVLGPQKGWHAIMANAYDPARRFRNGGVVPAYKLTNSWSERWGFAGQAWISETDLRRILDGGEACIPVRRSYGQRLLAALTGR